eukprot:9802098-Lingulodinium_polyedra.AAC.1
MGRSTVRKTIYEGRFLPENNAQPLPGHCRTVALCTIPRTLPDGRTHKECTRHTDFCYEASGP